MIVGVLRERKKGEHRVGLTPAGTSLLKHGNHTILVETNAGKESGFADIDYKNAGARICLKPHEVVFGSDMVVKVKEPIPQEYSLLKALHEKILFTYFHLSGSPISLTKQLLKNHITALAYETIEDAYGRLPLLAPMSSIAGVAAIQYAGEYLQKKHGGCGITLGHIDDTIPAHVVIVGGGIAGTSAAMTVSQMGPRVTILEKRTERVIDLKKIFKGKPVSVIDTSKYSANEHLRGAHVLIGATLHSGARAECVISKEQVLLTASGAVIIDISIDQGGCVWGSEPTNHDKPIFIKEGRVYCCVTNIPGQVPLQSTPALTSKTIPYILTLANNGLLSSFKKDEGLLRGLNTCAGYITCKTVAKDLKMETKYKDPSWLFEKPLRNMIVS
ncbi:MAG: alanine dehydrogenase [Parcubacteria group bacterium]|nr:alanine dehydrogenase [Parcubacteria group bacterium]